MIIAAITPACGAASDPQKTDTSVATTTFSGDSGPALTYDQSTCFGDSCATNCARDASTCAIAGDGSVETAPNPFAGTRFRLTLDTVVVTRTGQQACGLGLLTCDPYVVLTVAGVQKQVPPIFDTSLATWREIIFEQVGAELLLGGGLNVSVLDRNESTGLDIPLGQCLAVLSTEDLQAGYARIPCVGLLPDVVSGENNASAVVHLSLEQVF